MWKFNDKNLHKIICLKIEFLIYILLFCLQLKLIKSKKWKIYINRKFFKVDNRTCVRKIWIFWRKWRGILLFYDLLGKIRYLCHLCCLVSILWQKMFIYNFGCYMLKIFKTLTKCLIRINEYFNLDYSRFL